MSTNVDPISEIEILSDVIAPERGDIPRDVAKLLLEWRFSSRAAARMTQLADRNNRGTITEAELDELERYLRVGALINLIQAKARLSLTSTHDSAS